MPTTRRIHIQPAGDFSFEQGIGEIQRELQLPLVFPPEVDAAAMRAADNPRMPGLDRTDIALVTIDPPGSMDLDQAMYLERNASGYRVYYAIADVAAFVTAGDSIDIEAHRRGATLYGADSRIPLHPAVLSEGAASLLPDRERPALLWTLDLGTDGNLLATDVRRARIRSRARLDYAGMQQRIDAGSADPMWRVLQEVGELRQKLERARGGVSIALPEQEIRRVGGRWELAYRMNQPVEDWNAQISLLTGMAAAQLMVRAKVGLLRTLPPPDPRAIVRLRWTAKALGIAWPDAETYPDFIRTLDPAQPRHVAMMTSCTTVLRGAGYAAFNGALPEQPMHSALAAEYAHATAPLRRLVDRYVGEVCVALCANQPVPEWALAALPGLPPTMQAADHRARQYQRAVIDLTEAVVLAPRIGETFDGTIIDITATAAGTRGNVQDAVHSGIVMVRDPAIEARVTANSGLLLGAGVRIKLVEADPDRRLVHFDIVDQI
ncbi:RNB domain-containing ribonuclease [soil metagenome]